jgi:hypothetical protein
MIRLRLPSHVIQVNELTSSRGAAAAFALQIVQLVKDLVEGVIEEGEVSKLTIVFSDFEVGL